MNIKMPLISIIVPVYKVEKYLDCCVESILAQTYKNIELILVDDGSPDNSGAMCDAWAQKDSRVRVIHKQNGGASTARNVALDVARGEYIGFVDSDDFIHQDMYMCLMQALENASVKIACCESVEVEEDVNTPLDVSKECTIKEFTAEETMEEIYAYRMGTSFWRRLFHASVLEGIRFPEGEINEEYPLLIPIAVKAGGTVAINRVLYYYRNRADSVTGTVHTSLKTMKIVATNLQRMKKQEKENGWSFANFPLFVAQESFFVLLSILKNHKVLAEELKDLYYQYLGMARKNKKAYLASKASSLKNKILYFLVVTGIYRKLRRIKIK